VINGKSRVKLLIISKKVMKIWMEVRMEGLKLVVGTRMEGRERAVEGQEQVITVEGQELVAGIPMEGGESVGIQMES